MKKLFFVFLSASLLLLAFSCKNSLNTLAPYQDVTVVYGLLDQNDSIHYIRINKAYQTTGNAYTAATQYDSINYPAGTLNVQLQDYSNGSLVSTITLDTTSGVLVNPGTFSYPKQELYYTKHVINPNDQYNLIITNVKTNKVITGSTTMLPDVAVTVGGFSDFLSTSALDLTSPSAFPTTVEWSTNNEAMIYQLTMVFYYNEIDSIKKDTTTKMLNWIFGQQTSPTLESGYPMTQQYSGENFLQFVRTSLPLPASNIKRVAKYIEVMFVSGSSDLNVYILLSQPSLDVNQEKPFYTDLKNGVGIFTSRHIQSSIRPLSPQTVDSLVDSDPGLNFKPR